MSSDSLEHLNNTRNLSDINRDKDNSFNDDSKSSVMFDGDDMWDILDGPDDDDMNFVSVTDGALSLISNEVFDIRDFTTASAFERLVRAIELVLKTWRAKLDCECEEDIILSEFFKHETKFRYKLTAFKSSQSNLSSTGLTNKLLSKSNPTYASIRDGASFPVRSHRLVRYFGVNRFLMLEVLWSREGFPPRVINLEQSSSRAALSALSLAAKAAKLIPMPCFVVRSNDPHPDYVGFFLGCSPAVALSPHPLNTLSPSPLLLLSPEREDSNKISTNGLSQVSELALSEFKDSGIEEPNLSIDYFVNFYEETSPYRQTLGGILEYFQAVTGTLGTQLNPSITSISIRTSFKVNLTNIQASSPYPLRDTLSTISIPTLSKFSATKIFQSGADPIETIYLHCRWPSFSLGTFVEDSGYSELHPETAPIWELRLIPASTAQVKLPCTLRIRNLLGMLIEDKNPSRMPLLDLVHERKSPPKGFLDAISRTVKNSLDALGLPSEEQLHHMNLVIEQHASPISVSAKFAADHHGILSLLSFPINGSFLPCVAQFASSMKSVKGVAVVWESELIRLRNLWNNSESCSFLGPIPVGPANLPEPHQNFLHQKVTALHAALQAKRVALGMVTPAESLDALSTLSIFSSNCSTSKDKGGASARIVATANVREPIIPIYPPATSDVSILHAERHLKLAASSIQTYLDSTHAPIRNEMTSFLRANPRSDFTLYSHWRQIRFESLGLPAPPPPIVVESEFFAKLPELQDKDKYPAWVSNCSHSLQKLIFNDWIHASQRIENAKIRTVGDAPTPVSAPVNFSSDSEGEFALASLESANVREVLEAFIGSLITQFVVRFADHPLVQTVPSLKHLSSNLLERLASLLWGWTDESGIVRSVFDSEDGARDVELLVELIEEAEKSLLFVEAVSLRFPELQDSSNFQNESNLLELLLRKEVIQIATPKLRQRVLYLLSLAEDKSNLSFRNNSNLNDWEINQDSLTTLNLPRHYFMREITVESIAPCEETETDGLLRSANSSRMYASFEDSQLNAAFSISKSTTGARANK